MSDQQQVEKEVVTSYMPTNLIETVDEVAEARDLSRSKAVAEILQDTLSGHAFQTKVVEAVHKLTQPDVRALRVSVVREDGIQTVSAARGGDKDDRELDLSKAELAMIREHAARNDASLEEVFEYFEMLNEEYEWTSVVAEGE